MRAAELITKISELGGRLYLDAGELRLKAPKGALTDELRAELALKKQELIDFLTAAQSAEGKTRALIGPANRNEPLPASFSQQRLWFLEQLDPGKPIYNMPFSMRLKGALNKAALQGAFDDLVARHESLHTRFESDGQALLQTIDPALRTVVEYAVRHGVTQESVDDWVSACAAQAFDLRHGPLLRAHVLETSEHDYQFVIVMHHIISDAWSMSILLQELAILYEARCTGKQAQQRELAIQYADFAAWQQNWLQGAELERQTAYWSNKLAGAPPLLELPTDKPRPAIQTYRGDHLAVKLDAELTRRLRSTAQGMGVSMFMLTQAAFNVLLARYSGTDDIIIGTPIAGRQHDELEPLIGLFLNTLVLRNDLSGNPSFAQVVDSVRKTTLAAYDHQDLPFEKLVEALRPERQLSYAPVFQVLFNLRAQGGSSAGLPGLATEFGDIERHTAMFDLSLSIDETADSLLLEFEFATDLFKRDSIARMAAHYTNLLESVSTDTTRGIYELPMLDAAERQQLLVEWNETNFDYPADLTVHGMFEQQVLQRPDAIALRAGGTELSYAELNRRANQLACHLRELGAGPDMPIALGLERSIDMVVGVLGVLKAGAAYLPLDPAYPAERIAYMLADSRAPILVTQADLLANMPATTARTICIDELGAPGPDADQSPAATGVTAGNLAYLIYTSGSTGNPKGVQLEHRSVVNFLSSMAIEPGIDAHDRLLAVTTLCFDISVLELLLPLSTGASVVIASRDETTDGFALRELLESAGITMMQATPATWRMLLATGWTGNSDLKVLCGGEALDRELAEQLHSAAGDVWNMYGPTETTIWSSCHQYQPTDEFISVGRPIGNTRMYVLDAQLEPVPVGVNGELFIGGDGLARGYRDRPELNAEKFVADPFLPGKRMYRTGDLARFLPDGQLQIQGRTDFQVKLRGFRIELGEIEAALTDIGTIEQAVVLLREDTPGDQRLVGYYTSSGPAIDPDVLRAELSTRLPTYMVPSAFMLLDELPLTPNGKINRKALPAPEWTAADAYVAPTTPVEEALAAIWQTVLKLDQVGIHDNFFSLGGHSLLAMQLVSRIRDALQTKLEPASLFINPTIAELACHLESGTQADTIQPADRSKPLPMSFAQQRLWFIDAMRLGTATYNVPWGARIQGRLDLAALQATIDRVVRRHESLRTTFADYGDAQVQIIDPSMEIAVNCADLSSASQADIGDTLSRLIHAPFDLGKGPLLRVDLLNTPGDECILLICMHHIICDVWSIAILFNEIRVIYESIRSGTEAQLPELKLQYADYSVWQRDSLSAGELDRQLSYWKQQLADAPPLLNLPLDKPRPAVESHNGAIEKLTLEKALAERLGTLARQMGCTQFALYLAAFSVLLSRYSGENDIVIGTPISGRQRTELENMIGFFLNTLAIRADMSGNPSFSELVERIRKTTIDAFANQDLPFEKLVEELRPERNLSHAPIFQVLFVLHQQSGGEVRIDNMPVIGMEMGEDQFEFMGAKFDLQLSVMEVADGLSTSLLYNTDLFDAATMERMLQHFRLLLEGIATAPDSKIGALPLLSEAETRQLLVEWNQTAFAYPQGLTMHSLFEERAAAQPDAIAVWHNGSQISYGELNRRANRLAKKLLSMGAKRGDLIGISVERCPDMIAGMLAILKTGAAYVPLDPNYPPDRVTFMLEDSAAAILLTQEALLARLPKNSAQLLCLDSFDWGNPDEQDENPVCGVQPSDLGYVIYTSGSTGIPKGVAIEHRNAVALIEWARDVFQPEQFAGVLASTSICFDLSVFEIFCTLGIGGRIVLVRDALALPELPQDANVTLINTVPSAIAELVRVNGIPASIKTVNLAGEPLTTALADAIYELGTVRDVNDLYGPSEDTTYSTWTRRAPGAAPSIGRPVHNTQAYILDPEGKPTPIGVPGELYLGGAGVTRGYLNRPELTAEKFPPNPFSDDSNARLYRTGDRVRYRSDASIEFMGRLDHQVKLRGFRIELGEIETRIEQHEAVDKALVIVREDNPGDQRLVAYLQAGSDNLDREQIEKWEAEQVSQWEDLWQNTYSAKQDVELGSDFSGWISSYTGEAIPVEEMRVWIDSTAERIKELHAERVLEIGSGTGLVAARVAPHCKHYLATDFSAAVIETLNKLKNSRTDLAGLELRQSRADELTDIANGSYDAVIINSVAQYFPDADYFTTIVERAIGMLRDGGHLFLGDLRSLPLLAAYHSSVQLFKANDSLTVANLASRIRQRIDEEEELLIDPAMFAALKSANPRISNVRFQLKRGTALNELTRFRYDVIVEVGQQAEIVDAPEALHWDKSGLTLEQLAMRINSTPRGLLIRGIPNARLSEDSFAMERFADADDMQVKDLREKIAATNLPGIDPESIYELARRNSWDIQMLASEPGTFDVLCQRSGAATKLDGLQLPTKRSDAEQAFTNDPLRGRLARSLEPILRAKIKADLPEYMMPSAFIILDEFPLTPNGKIDRKKLPAPEWRPQKEYVAPRTPTEEVLAEIWAETLRVERVGIYDDFFALGGHSLLAMQLVSRIRDRLQAELQLVDLFRNPTIATMASQVDGGTPEGADAIVPCDRSQPLPMSFAQQRMWFLHVMEPHASNYNVPWVTRLAGTLDIAALQRALDTLIERHESLRTIFADSEAGPIQVIVDSMPVKIAEHDLIGASATDVRAKVNELWTVPFDLEQGPLLNLAILHLDHDNSILLLCMHHIICDNWSLGLLYREMATLYEAYRNNTPVILPKLPIQYADYTVWQSRHLAGAEFERQIGYWKQQLSAAPPLLDLPTDKPRPPVETHVGATEDLLLNKQLADALTTQARASGCTLFSLVLAAFNVLLHRYSGEDDIVVGTPISGRRRSELEGIVGFFLNTLAMRTDTSGNPRFSELVERTRQVTLDAFANQDVPFEKLVEELQPVRNLSHAPIFQVLFVLNTLSRASTEFGNLEVRSTEWDFTGAKFDLQLTVSETQDGLATSLLYNTALFERASIQRMLEHFRVLLESVAANPQQGIDDLPLLSHAERDQIVTDFNATTVDFPATSVVSLVEAQVARTPDTVAIRSDRSNLSYAELNQRANRLARQLIQLGAGRSTLVGVCAERSPETVVAILAVLKTGAAYVPIDPHYPSERVAFMLADSQAAVLITHTSLTDRLPPHAATTVWLDKFDWHTGDDSNLQIEHGAGDLVYAIYTSGSTGQPKGVLLHNQALANLLQWQQSQPRLNQPASTLQFASFSFDVSFQELFSTWQQGGTLVMIDEDLRRDLPGLARFIAAEKIERLFLPYAALQPLVECVLSDQLGADLRIRDIVVAGEQLQITPAIRKLFMQLDGAKLHNQYGPSETHVVTAYTLEENIALWNPMPPIGKPVANTQVYILDKRLQPVPVGVPGELYIGGAQVAQGYLRRAELTAEKFVANPFSNKVGARLYRTGDRVRFLTDGNLEYLGRTDDQVKWRGFRIEPGEIESALTTHNQVLQAAVMLREDSPGDKRLVAYIVPDSNQVIDTAEIRSFAKDKLPDYMVPSLFVVLDTLPLTPSGKIARRLLPQPDSGDIASSQGESPVTVGQITIARIWEQLLKVDGIKLDDNFFDLGGHSLLTIKLIHAIEAATGEQVTIADVFENPTVREFARLLTDVTWNEAAIAPQNRLSRIWNYLRRRAPGK